jgi:hypothetical protein
MIPEKGDGEASRGDRPKRWSMPSKIVVDDELPGVV